MKLVTKNDGMNHVNKWEIEIGEPYKILDYEVKLVIFIKDWMIGYGWEATIDGKNYGDWIQIEFSELLTMNSKAWDEIYRILMQESAERSIYEIIKNKAKENGN